MHENPQQEYTERLQARRAAVARLERRHIAIGNARLAIITVEVVLVWLALVRVSLSPAWLALPAAAFVVLMVIHDRVLRARTCAERAVAFYERALDRLADRWVGKGEPGDRFLDENHPYSEDLDLFGRGSLFELLSTARTGAGEETLARWLLAPASAEQLCARHEAIAELRSMLDLREDLAVLGEDFRTGVDPHKLAQWGLDPPVLAGGAPRILAAALSVCSAASLAVWTALDLPEPFLVVAVGLILFTVRFRKRVHRAIEAAERPGHDLKLLSLVLCRIERERFRAPRLVKLRSELDVNGAPPSQRIARLNRILEWIDSRENLLMRIIDPPLLLTPQFTFALEAWRSASGPALGRWLAAVGEFEALSALANYSYEHPGDPFPEIAAESPRFDGEGLGHPLLPESRTVRNDVCLDDSLRVLIVSGSNMSGKSTLLRTVGINTVLALAGAPVRARRLRLSPLMVGASIRILDSLQGGSSRFYTEITRLRLLLDLAKGSLPLLFLLDELLQGTNSHDRRIGAEGVVRGLVERGAAGLLTTHDLALAHIADTLARHAANVHFEDHIEDGKISFDYRLRPGIVTKSNALELMRSVGLEV